MINPNSPLSSTAPLYRAEREQGSAMERIGSGRRINQAADDPAALAIVARMAAQFGGDTQATRNINDAISLTQVAENSLAQVNASVSRMGELAVQAANGSLNDSDRANLQAEFQQLQQNIGDIFGRTEFNGISLLANEGTVDVQAGADRGESLGVNTIDVAARAEMVALMTADISTLTGASTAMESRDGATDLISSFQAQFGADQSRLASAYQQRVSANEVNAAASGRLADADYGSETAALVRAGILQDSATAMLVQGNVARESALSLLR